MGNRLNKPHMEVEGNQTTGKTSIAGWNTGGTDRHTDRRRDIQTDRHFFIVVLGLWEANKTTKKIFARSEKITDRSRYGII